MKKDSLALLNLSAQTIFDKKGFNLVALDIRDVSSITDYILIAEGNVDRHIIALANELEYVLKQEGEMSTHVEGKQSGNWVVLDYTHFIIHIFLPSIREKYQLEKLWATGTLVDLQLDVTPSKSHG